MTISTIYTDRDCLIVSAYPTSNYGPTDTSLNTALYGGSNQYALPVGFVITSAPISSQVSSVFVSIYSKLLGSASSVEFRRMTIDNWAESYPTYNNTTTTDTNKLIGQTWPATNSWGSYDVTEMYKDAKDAGMDVFGLKIQNVGENTCSFYTREYSSGTYKAYITITYTTPIPIKINIGDSWKEVDAMKINIGDSWKEVVSVKQNIGDTWKTVF